MEPTIVEETTDLLADLVANPIIQEQGIWNLDQDTVALIIDLLQSA